MEWCQTAKSDYKCITAWPSQPPKAFIAENFEFFLDGEIPIQNITDTPSPNISSIRISWRTQKNKQIGEKMPIFCDANNPVLCPVAAVLRIICSALLLHKTLGLPLGVCPVPNHPTQFQYITAAKTADFLCLATRHAHKFPSKHPDISAWSAHTIRVTAANLLHWAKFSDSFIQNCLHWHSNTFLMYLNTLYVAQSHKTALTLDLHGLQSPPPSTQHPAEPHEYLTPRTSYFLFFGLFLLMTILYRNLHHSSP